MELNGKSIPASEGNSIANPAPTDGTNLPDIPRFLYPEQNEGYWEAVLKEWDDAGLKKTMRWVNLVKWAKEGELWTRYGLDALQVKITLTQTQAVTKTIQFEYSNGSYLKALGELVTQEDQVEQNRAMNKTCDQKLIEHNIQSQKR
jgi:hypothetical protein